MMNPFSNSNSAENPSSAHSSGHSEDRIIERLELWTGALGYRIIHEEMQTHRQKTLRIFIDYLDSTPGKSIGIEDCARVSKALDEPLENDPELQTLFQGNYELEVSSPGVDRPLRGARDFEAFKGQRIRIHLYRPLTEEESGNPGYLQKNPKQKNFLGTLQGLDKNKVVLELVTSNASSKATKKKMRANRENSPARKEECEEGIKITIPLDLISKANLDPDFDFEGNDERE